MKWRKRRYFEILAPRSSLRQRVAYSLVIVRLILVPVIFLAVYYLFEMGWIVDRIVNIDAPATQMAEQASIQMSEARRAERNYFLLHDTGSLRINQEALTNVRQTLNTVADLEPGEKPTTQAGLDAVNIYQQRFSAAVSQLTQPGQTPPARIQQVVKAYEKDHGGPPAELFFHGRQRFSDDEWKGFESAVNASLTRLVGVRIRSSQELRLFRPNADVPVLRGTAVTLSRKEGCLWTNGYIPRLRTYPGFETPKPIQIEINRGTADMMTVMADVLALTKVNYNACDFSSGLPVTLKFADRVGEILTASPKGLQAPPLPFRFYI